MNYDDIQVEDAPPWLSDESGSRWNKILGTMKNALAAAAREAVLARFPDRAPLDALPELLADRNLDPAWAESAPAIRERIKRAWRTWTKAGLPASIEEALRLAGFAYLEIREQTQDSTLAWWEFEVRLFAPLPFVDDYLADGRWGDPGVWGDGGVWSPAMPPPLLARLRLLIKKWKGTHTRCRSVVVVHAGETWDATAPPGTWDDDPNALWGDDVTYFAVV